MEELESYAKQVEEFVTFGDLSELSKYLKKAQALNSKLDVAMEKVRKRAGRIYRPIHHTTPSAIDFVR